MRLQNKVAVIAGAGTGIGEAIAQKFAREGARLVLSGLPADPVQDVADAIRNAGGRAVVHLGDLAEELHAQACAYYEPFGIPGMNKLTDEGEKETYYNVWFKYLFVGLILPLFSPYLGKLQPHPYPDLPLDLKQYQDKGVVVPQDIAEATSYRELLALLQAYAKTGLEEMRAINPITRDKTPADIHRND
jgi:hypothetical protein